MDKQVKQLGQIIRELRRSHKITGEELGRRAGLSQSKISKIETGYSKQLKQDEIKRILNILGAPSTIQQQAIRALDEYTHNRNTQTWFKGAQHAGVTIGPQRDSRHIRVYVATGFPALVQTIEYRTASLRSKGFEGSELKALVKEALARQDLMWEEKRDYHFIMPQSVLYGAVTPKSGHLAQLDRIERIIGMANVKLGIIPVEAGNVPVEHGSFCLYDNGTLFQALPRYEIKSEDPADIELLSNVFTELSRLAYYDGDAIQLIRQAAKHFA